MKRFLLDGRYSMILRAFGMEPSEVLKKAGLPVNVLNQEHPAMTIDEYFRFMRVIEEVMPDDTVPVRMAAFDGIETFSPPIFAAWCSQNGRKCVARLARYKPLIGPLVMNWKERGDEFYVQIETMDTEQPVPAFVAETEIVFLLHLIRKATKEDIRPLAVRTASPISGTAFARFLGIQPEVGVRNEIVFRMSDMEKPFISENNAMWQYFEPEMNRRLSELERDDSVSAQVRSALTELLPAGEGTMAAAAARLGMSPRTLQRRLQHEQTTFQKVLNGTREVLVRHYVLHTDMTTQDMAYLLGYNEVNSFLRAFAIWTGKTIREFKKEHD